MAHPIEPTPTLEGKDAENFYKYLARKRTAKEIEQRRKIFEQADIIYRQVWKPYFKSIEEKRDSDDGVSI
ncbi:hypothetical protein HYU19_03530 [Candidatus Woesearchaeota archaeon]|nr:hypothetical protein [Candidatus Woesearchaeota archaeon]